MQQSLLPIKVTSEADPREYGITEGVDLKRIALGDDGNTYAVKRVADGAYMPLTEWVGYHLCRRCQILTPDFAVLLPKDQSPAYFGSRIATYAQIEHEPGSFRVSTFFSGHMQALAAVYALDAVYINPDRHGRNLFVRTGAGGSALLAFDFSQAWITKGLPFGNTEALRDSRTQKWWNTLKKLGCKIDEGALSLLQNTDAPWLAQVLDSAPTEWKTDLDTNAILEFWDTRRQQRINWARLWLT